MEILKEQDIPIIIKKYDIMAIDCFYNEVGALISKLFCFEKDLVFVDAKPSRIVNTICEIYNNDSYNDCCKKTKKIILIDKKIPVYINDDVGSIWLPFGATSNDNDSCFWLNMHYLSLNPHMIKVNKRNKSLKFIFEDGQFFEKFINYKNFMLKWGEGAALKYELLRVQRRILSQKM